MCQGWRYEVRRTCGIYTPCHRDFCFIKTSGFVPRVTVDVGATCLVTGYMKELLLESVVSERARRHDSQANPAERAIRMLEEQVKVMRLDFEKRPATELPTNPCLRPWLIRHAGWVDARFRVKPHGATPCQDACDSTQSSELLPFGELVLLHIPLPHTRRRNQNRTIYRGNSGWDGGSGVHTLLSLRHCTNCPHTSSESTC